MTLAEIKRTLRETHQMAVDSNGGIELTPIQRFQVFESVLQNLLEDGHITGAQFAKWVKVY